MENLQSGNLDYMVRFIIEKHGKQPDWALMLMATFPFDRTKDYPAVERYAMMGVVLDHVESFTYKKRNSMQTLGITHSILCSDDSIKISTLNDKPVLTIHLISIDNIITLCHRMH